MFSICLTDLADYNAGTLRYIRLELPMDADELSEKVRGFLADAKLESGESPHEEWFISDCETEWDIKVHEYEDIFKLNEQLTKLEELAEDWPAEVVEAVIRHESPDLEYAVECLRKGDFSYYSASDEEELGEYVVDEGLFGVEIPDQLAMYIDYGKIGHDMVCNGVVIYSDLGVALEVY